MALPKILQKQAQKQAQMQQWLLSGDPILEAEARQWLTASLQDPDALSVVDGQPFSDHF